MRPGDDFYRKKAEECEAMAERSDNPHHKERWLKMAKDWRSLIAENDPAKGPGSRR